MKYLLKVVFSFIVIFSSLCKAQKKSATIKFTFNKISMIETSFKLSGGAIAHKETDDVLTIIDSLTATPILSTNRKKVHEITPSNQFVILRHRYNFLDSFEFLFEKGDEVAFDYENGIIKVRLLNRTPKSFDYEFEQTIAKKYYKDKYSSISKFLQSSLFLSYGNKNINLFKEREAIEKTNYEKSIKVLDQQRMFLDSLKMTHLISTNIYSFYFDKIKYTKLLIEVSHGKRPIMDFEGGVKTAPVSKMGETYRREFVKAFTDKFLVSTAKPLDLKDGVNRDYRESFEIIANSSFFTLEDKEWLLEREFDRITSTFSKEDTRKYFILCKKYITNVNVIEKLQEKYALELDSTRYDKMVLALLDKNKTENYFDDFRKRNQGKVIYVDFWASWCAPCRAAFPISEKLRESLKDKEIVFVYLSIDKSFEAWAKASEKEKLVTYPNNFIIANVNNSEFIKQQKVNSIPRYMIFDKQGKLVYANAPNVENKGLAELLVKLANQ